ncbi:hypothetical protein SCAR479_03718 [Seiridium cardinale]|uniref:Uncharacterized protein n=1 Tax=Seiridium cardinale TaxID=138064 RepID=A0ABR2XZK9_9PEZI
MRSNKPWLGLLVIAAVAAITVVAMMYSLVVEINHHRTEPIDNGDGDRDDELVDGIFRNVKRNMPTVIQAPTASIPTVEIQVRGPSTLQDLQAMTIITETIFSTATVHVTRTSTPSPSTTDPRNSGSISTLSDTIMTESASPTTGAMADGMFCPATDRPHDVYMPCPYLHTGQSASNAVVSSGSRKRAYNPYPAMLKELPNFIEANKQLVKGVGRLTTRVVQNARIKTAKIMHSTYQGQMRSDEARIRGGGGSGKLPLEFDQLEEKNERLRERIYDARQVIQMQQKLLDSHMKIIEKQRVHLEESLRLQMLWTRTQNQTRQ